MPRKSHVMMDEAGVLLSVDPSFGALMRMDAAALPGSRAAALIAPADLSSCRASFDRLRETGQRFTVVKRLVRGDGSEVQVEVEVSEVAAVKGRRSFALTVARCGAPVPMAPPDHVLTMARHILLNRRRRAAIFGTDLFPDVAWDMLLSTYIAEAEGRTIDLAELQAHGETAPSVVARWSRALHAAGLIDYETAGTGGLASAPLRLSADAHRRFETYLSSLLAIPNPMSVETAG